MRIIHVAMQQLAAHCLLLLMCSFSTTALAALDYQVKVELNAPADIRPLLTQHLDIFRWRDNPALDDVQLRRIYRLTPDNISTLLATAGYYSPKITSSLQEQDGIFKASFSVEPGEPSRVVSTNISAQGTLTEDPARYQKWLQAQQKTWPLKNGEIFTQAAWSASKQGLLNSLMINQYPKAQLLHSKAEVNPDTHQVTLNLLIDSGASYQFGATTINGLKRYPASIIERLNAIRPGDPYSQTRLLRLQSQLQSSTYFRSVDVLTEPDPDHATRLAIVVNVQEMSRQKIGLGVGVSTDSGPRGQIEYENLNILDSNLRFTSALKLNAKLQQLSAQVERPRNELGYIDSLGISTKHTDIAGEITSQNSIAAKRTRRKGRIETSLVGQYLTEHQTVAGALGDNLQALTLNYIWTYRDLDNRIMPTKGYIFSTEIGGATQALLSDQSFIRSRNRAIYYYPITQYDSLTLRGELGIVFARSSDGIPSEFLFRTGGDLSVRGYAYQSLGVTAGDAIVGGRYLATGSVEYTHWLTPAWGAALFYDLGNATDTPQNFRPVAGYGAGARWRSPIGPVNLDLAYGEASASYRIHFSLGSAF